MYYLHKNLKLKPDLNDVVETYLPEECAPTSIKVGNNRNSNRTDSLSKRKRGGSDIADAIQELLENSQMSFALGRQKLRYMEKENSRLVRQHKLLEERHQQQKNKDLFEEWEKIQSNIRALRQDLRDNLIDDDETRADIEEDISGLVKRKNFLACALGLK